MAAKDARVYPWGDTFDRLRCNTEELGLKTTTPVGIFPDGASPYGVLDMSGNVFEWTQSRYRPYPYRADDGRELVDNSGEIHIWRGGSYLVDKDWGRCAYRYGAGPDIRLGYVGFRAVVSPSTSGL
ncbi:MAG: SUMF1/EgtB/PvdO family nonheme iron enzyme [Candidatus Promineifilaceae bacterium]